MVESTAPREVLDWLRANAIPLDGPSPGLGFDDLRPLADAVAGARIVSLGEATHGTREFFQLKHRFLEWLAAEHGYRIFGIEATFPESLAVDDFVQGGVGDPADLLIGLRFWTWDTEEVLDLVKWMRQANQGRSADNVLRFYGYDMQFPGTAALGTLDYLDAVAPALAGEAAHTFQAITSDNAVAGYWQVPHEVRQAVHDCARSVLAALDEHEEAWVERTGRRAFLLGRLHATVLFQYLNLSGSSNIPEARDRAMADNVIALLDLEGDGARMVSWAHNGHAQKAPLTTFTSMGTHLRQHFGDGYLTVGFAFATGSFQAGDDTGEAWLKDFTVPPPRSDSLDAALAAIGLPVFALDLRSAPASGPVHEWLAAKPPSRGAGAGYHPSLDEEYWDRDDPRDLFDILVFVADTTAARRLPLIQRRVEELAAKTTGTAELTLPGGEHALEGPWRVAGDLPYYSYDFAVDDTGGEVAIHIGRPPSPWRWGKGVVVGKLSADELRGEKVCCRARVRARPLARGAEAWLSLLAVGADGESQTTLAAAHGADIGPEWTDVVLEAELPDDFDRLMLKYELCGDGDAWLSAVEIVSLATSPS